MINPHIRRRMRDAVDALADAKMQEAVWRHDGLAPGELTFDDAVLLIIDELATPYPDELLDHVLRNDAELKAFLTLSNALDKLVLVIGARGTYLDALKAEEPWRAVQNAARSLRGLLGDE